MFIAEPVSKSAVTSLKIHDAMEVVIVIVVKAFEADSGAPLIYNHLSDNLEFAVALWMMGFQHLTE